MTLTTPSLHLAGEVGAALVTQNELLKQELCDQVCKLSELQLTFEEELKEGKDKIETLLIMNAEQEKVKIAKLNAIKS